LLIAKHSRTGTDKIPDVREKQETSVLLYAGRECFANNDRATCFDYRGTCNSDSETSDKRTMEYKDIAVLRPLLLWREMFPWLYN
jgi:hypothetical protein